MPTIAEVRAQFPQYQDIPDAALADALHKKFYSDMPRPAFDAKIGFGQSSSSAGQEQKVERPVGYAEDIAKAVPSGLAKGVAGIAGLPGDVSSLIGAGLEYLEQSARGEGDEEFAARVAERKAKLGKSPLPNLMPTSAAVRGGIESVTGKLYEPQTTPGKYAGTIAEFAPAALAGPGGIVRKGVNFAVVPGVASEAAGQLTEGTAAEPYARAGAAVVGGVGAAMLNTPRTATRAIGRAMSDTVDDAALLKAAALKDSAAKQGINLTWAEAIEQVAPGSGLTNMQRIVESTPAGRETLAPMMGRRAAEIEQAGRRTFDDIAAATANPSTIGPQAGQAAEEFLGDVRRVINKVAEPYYGKAAATRIPVAEMQQVKALPGWDEAVAAIRGDPQLKRYVGGLPEDSVGFLNEAKKYLDNAAENAAGPVNAQRNMQRSAGYGQDARAVREQAVAASTDYETALSIERAAREKYLEPLLQGPVGRIAAKDTTTQNAVNTLFPKNPLANSEGEIATAVSALASKQPKIAREIVRAYTEGVFNSATRNLQGGANQFGGAKFAVAIAGNPQQRKNLEAAVKAMSPDGDKVWSGFKQFLETVEATGTRQPIGSKTAFNTQELIDLSSGGAISGAAKLGTSPGKWLTVISDSWSRWQLGRNVDQIAKILTNGDALPLFRALASKPAGSREALILTSRLAAMANQGAKKPAE